MFWIEFFLRWCAESLSSVSCLLHSLTLLRDVVRQKLHRHLSRENRLLLGTPPPPPLSNTLIFSTYFCAIVSTSSLLFVYVFLYFFFHKCLPLFFLFRCSNMHPQILLSVLLLLQGQWITWFFSPQIPFLSSQVKTLFLPSWYVEPFDSGHSQ